MRIVLFFLTWFYVLQYILFFFWIFFPNILLLTRNTFIRIFYPSLPIQHQEEQYIPRNFWYPELPGNLLIHRDASVQQANRKWSHVINVMSTTGNNKRCTHLLLSVMTEVECVALYITATITDGGGGGIELYSVRLKLFSFFASVPMTWFQLRGKIDFPDLIWKSNNYQLTTTPVTFLKHFRSI